MTEDNINTRELLADHNFHDMDSLDMAPPCVQDLVFYLLGTNTRLEDNIEDMETRMRLRECEHQVELMDRDSAKKELIEDYDEMRKRWFLTRAYLPFKHQARVDSEVDRQLYAGA